MSRSADQRNQQIRTLIPWLPSGVLPLPRLLRQVVCLAWSLCWGAFLSPSCVLSSGCPIRRFLVCVQVFTRSETFANQVLIKTSRTIGVGPSDKNKQGKVGAVMPKGSGAVMLSVQFEAGPSCPSWSQDKKFCQCRRVSAHATHCRASHRMRGAGPQAWRTDTCSPNWERRCA